jgi:HEAT repeats
LVAFTGIITELTTPRDRGEFISNAAKISNASSILMTILMAAFLGASAPLYRYQIFLSTGMICGLIGATTLWRIPEAGIFRRPPPSNLFRELKWSVATKGRRWFMAMMLGIPVTQGITNAFIILIAKQGYGLTDQRVVLFVVISIVGGILASYTYARFLDQLGSRPLLVLNSLMDLAGVTMVILLPKSFSVVLMVILFFLKGYVATAFESAIQHYFISITNRTHQLAHGIITRGFAGVTGGLALAFSGWALEHVKQFTGVDAGDPLIQFRFFYIGLAVLLTIRTVIFFKLPPLRSQGIRSSLSALFSPWDWRAISAVRRAVEIQNETEESKAITALMKSGSSIYQADLEHYLKSPSIFVRLNAMDALRTVNSNAALVSILERDLKVNQFTTAHRAAFWLGRWKVADSIPLLREAVNSRDFLLSGAAIHALVELGEQKMLPLIEEKFVSTDNPYILIEGARVLSMWGDKRHYRLLVEKYLLRIPPQAQDELSLSVARLLGLYDAFYQDLGMWRREPVELINEWQERLDAPDKDEFITALRNGASRQFLTNALNRRKKQLQPWFYEDTLRFLDQLPEVVWPEPTFLMAFLFLNKPGFHFN